MGRLVNHGKNLGRGSQVPWARFNEEQVLKIKRLIREGVKIKSIAEQFDAPWSSIHNIRIGSSWGYLQEA